MSDRIEPLHVILGGIPCEEDGPVRDEDDNSPKWHDKYTEIELASALRFHAAKTRMRGQDEIADEIYYAAECIEDLCEIRDKLMSQIAAMAGAGMEIAGGIENVKRQIQASIESLSKTPPL